MTPLLILTTLLLPLTTLAAPLIQNVTFFTLIATRSASPIHFGSVHANETEIWIGKDSSGYCPGVEGLSCPDPSNDTSFYLSQGILSLGVQVPGGQEIYIEDCGRVRYTPAGASNAIPATAITDGWSVQRGLSFAWLSHEDGTFFCPSHPDEAPQEQGPWQMWVNVTGASLPSGCLYASLIAAGDNRTAEAYEYL